jgi:hypothetical protein
MRLELTAPRGGRPGHGVVEAAASRSPFGERRRRSSSAVFCGPGTPRGGAKRLTLPNVAAWLLAILACGCCEGYGRGCDCWVGEKGSDVMRLAEPEAQVPGSRNFKKLDCWADAGGWALFSYELPPEMDPAQVVSTLRTQIERRGDPMPAAKTPGSPSCWSPMIQTATELQLRCPGPTYPSTGYLEWHFLVDPRRRKVTGSRVNVSGQVEREQHASLLPELYKAHAQH